MRKRALGEQIKRERERVGWSQEALAERMEVAQSAVSTWESGASTPRDEKIYRLDELLRAEGRITEAAFVGRPVTEDELRATLARIEAKIDRLGLAASVVAYAEEEAREVETRAARLRAGPSGSRSQQRVR